MFNCCLPLVSETIGWQLCSEMSYPDPASGLVLPLTGPLLVAVTLTKQDRGLQQYVVEAAYNYIAQVPLALWTLALFQFAILVTERYNLVRHIQPSEFQVLCYYSFHSQYMGRYVEHKLQMLIGGTYSFYLRNNAHKQSVVSV